MQFSDINPSSPRGIAYETAKSRPGIEVRFQGEDGFKTVRYAKGMPAEEVFGQIIAEAIPGHWYEKDVIDVTKMTEDKTSGFRVKDETDADI